MQNFFCWNFIDLEDGESDDDILPSVEIFPPPLNTFTPSATISRPNNHPPYEIEVSENGVTGVPNDVQTTYSPHVEHRYIGMFKTCFFHVRL